MHFVATEGFTKIVPPFLPSPMQLVYISGACEILGGIGLLIPRTRKLAAVGLISLLLAVFPANVYHAIANVQVGGFLNSRIYQWSRLPLQAVFIWTVFWASQDKRSKSNEVELSV